MSDKPIPNADVPFQMMAESFARNIASDPARFEVSQVDASALSQAVERDAAAARGGVSRSGNDDLGRGPLTDASSHSIMRI